jgi:hypothetical protein
MTTVRRDGRPRVTVLVAVWFDNALYFSTAVDGAEGCELVHKPERHSDDPVQRLGGGLDVVLE